MGKKFFHYPTTYDEIERFVSIYHPHELIIINSGLERNQISEIIQFARIQTKTIHLIEDAKDYTKQIFQNDLLKRFYKPDDIEFFFYNLRFNEYPFAAVALYSQLPLPRPGFLYLFEAKEVRVLIFRS